MRTPEGYDIQGKPFKEGSLVGFYVGDHERIISGRCRGMSNGKIMVEVQLGTSYKWLAKLWPKAVVVLEEPIWPN